MTTKLTVIEGGKSETTSEKTAHPRLPLNIEKLEDRVRISPREERLEERIRLSPIRYAGSVYMIEWLGRVTHDIESEWSGEKLIDRYIKYSKLPEVKEQGWQIPDLPLYFAVWKALYHAQKKPRETTPCSYGFLDPEPIGYSWCDENVPGKRVITSSCFSPEPKKGELERGIIRGRLTHALSQEERTVALPLYSPIDRLISVIEDGSEQQDHKLSTFTDNKPIGMLDKLAQWLRLEYAGGDLDVDVNCAIRDGKPELIRPSYTFVFHAFHNGGFTDRRTLKTIRGGIEDQHATELVHGVRLHKMLGIVGRYVGVLSSGYC